MRGVCDIRISCFTADSQLKLRTRIKHEKGGKAKPVPEDATEVEIFTDAIGKGEGGVLTCSGNFIRATFRQL